MLGGEHAAVKQFIRDMQLTFRLDEDDDCFTVVMCATPSYVVEGRFFCVERGADWAQRSHVLLTSGWEPNGARLTRRRAARQERQAQALEYQDWITVLFAGGICEV